MRIQHIIDRLAVGGAEILLRNTLHEFTNNYPQLENHVVTTYAEGALVNDIKACAKYVNLGITRANCVFGILRLRKYIIDNEIEVVHSHLVDSTLVARLALNHRVKLVTTYHNTYYDRRSTAFSYKRLWLDKLTYRSCYRSIFVSIRVKEVISNAIGISENSTVLDNFCERKFRPTYTLSSNSDLKLISIGMLKEQKNYALAIQAIAKVGSGVKLDIYGEGHLRAPLTRMIQTSGADVRLQGKHEITPGLLSQHDAFLMTSWHEGMPIAIIEAMATGMPMILNDLPELRETASDAAIYFDKDSLTGLVDVMLKILKDKNQLISLSHRSVKNSSRFHPDKYTGSLLKMYQN